MNDITKAIKTLSAKIVATISIITDFNAQTVTATFRDGKVLRVNCADLSEELKTMAMLHGVKQKIGDAAAIARNTDTGASATVDDKYNAMSEVVERLNSNGDWNKVREGGEGGGGNSGQLVRALIEHTGKPKEAVEATLAAWSKEQKAAVRANPKIAAIIARFANEAAAKKGVDSDELLGELI